MNESAKKKAALQFLLDFYDVTLRETAELKIAAALGLDRTTIAARIKKSPELQYAKQLAEKRRGTRTTLSGYVFQRLSPEAQAIWEEIQFWEESGGNWSQVERILSGKTRSLRQELFIHALAVTSYDLSSACRMVGVSRQQLLEWKTDLAFLQLVEEIQWHKKNFFEKALVQLVEQQHPAAVIFANRTINADRGYSEKLEVSHSGSLDMGFKLEELDLPIETQKEILNAIRLVKASKANPQPEQRQIGPIEV